MFEPSLWRLQRYTLLIFFDSVASSSSLGAGVILYSSCNHKKRKKKWKDYKIRESEVEIRLMEILTCNVIPLLRAVAY